MSERQRASGRRRTSESKKKLLLFIKLNYKKMQLNLFTRAPDMADRLRHAKPIDEEFEKIRREENMIYLLKRERIK